MAEAIYIRYISGIEGHEVLAHVRDRHCAAVVGIRGRHSSQVGSCSGIKGVTHHTYRSRACQQSPLFEYRSARTIGGVIGSRLEDIVTSGLPENNQPEIDSRRHCCTGITRGRVSSVSSIEAIRGPS